MNNKYQCASACIPTYPGQLDIPKDAVGITINKDYLGNKLMYYIYWLEPIKE